MGQAKVFGWLMGRGLGWLGAKPRRGGDALPLKRSPNPRNTYGSFEYYLFCEEHGMKKYMRFTMFRKETEDEEYRDDPYRAVNFALNENGCPFCPGGKEFHYMTSRPVRYNHYGRTEELWQCEDCPNCPLKPECCKCAGNRVVRLNEELCSIHKLLRT